RFPDPSVMSLLRHRSAGSTRGRRRTRSRAVAVSAHWHGTCSPPPCANPRETPCGTDPARWPLPTRLAGVFLAPEHDPPPATTAGDPLAAAGPRLAHDRFGRRPALHAILPLTTRAAAQPPRRARPAA